MGPSSSPTPEFSGLDKLKWVKFGILIQSKPFNAAHARATRRRIPSLRLKFQQA